MSVSEFAHILFVITLILPRWYFFQRDQLSVFNTFPLMDYALKHVRTVNVTAKSLGTNALAITRVLCIYSVSSSDNVL